MKTMKMLTILVLALGLMVCSAKVSEAAPMGTAFTYQGRLIDANSAADGLYDFHFKLFDANVAGSEQGSTIDVNDLDVIDGYFTVELDYGSSVFDGNAVWLEVDVRAGDSIGDYTTLIPRQEVTATPYAIYTGLAGDADTIDGYHVSDLDGRYVNEGQLNSVNSAMILSESITASDIAANAVGSAEIVANAVHSSEIASGAVGTFEIQNAAVTSIKIADSAVTAAKLAMNSVSSSTIQDQTVASSDIASNAVYASKLASDGQSLSKVTGGVMAISSGNVGIGTTSPSEKLYVAGNAVISSNPDSKGTRLYYHGAGDSTEGLRFESRWGGSWGPKMIITSQAGRLGIGTTSPSYPLEMGSGAHCTAGGVWADASSVVLKENFSEVDTAEILAKLQELPVRRWNYKAEDATVKHMGPVAEDFHALFGLGDSDKAISGVDRSGVALAAIQELYELVKEKDAEIAELKARLAAIESALAKLTISKEGGQR